MERGFEFVVNEKAKVEGEKYLPLRATKTSAGYDFHTTQDLVITPQDKLKFWTDVKAKMPEGEVLLLVVRSSSGIDFDLMMANTIGVVDSDYHNNVKNDGNIGICLRNMRPNMRLEGYTTLELQNDFTGENDLIYIPQIVDLTEENTVRIPKGERIAQGIFVKYQEAENCNSEATRVGGTGSTN